MKKIVLCFLLCTLTFVMYGCACSKEEEIVEYGEKEAVAEGTVTLSGDTPKISISNIKAKKGADIDFLSNVIVEDEDKFEDLKVWVDASAVDIYEPGDYTAKYTFEYDGKSIEHRITVTILDEEVEVSASSMVQDNSSMNDTEQATTTNSGNEVVQNTTKREDTNEPTTTKKNEVSTTTKSNVTTATTTKKNETVTTTKKNETTTTSKKNETSTTTKKNEESTTTKKDATTATTKKEIVTTQGSSTSIQNINYAHIELLSGSVVSIKNTTAKYIVSTRTDVSYITKNDVKYKVSKLIITYNTGDERTLETVEEKCN